MAVEWSRICCPVDFSETARGGLRVAADVSRRFGAELVLLYIEEGARIADELAPAGPVEPRLEELRREAVRLGAPSAQVARTRGEPDVAIVEYATAHDVDLVVMGTHGRVDREHMLTGSVAEGVVRNAPCPVLTVRETWRK